MQFGFYGQCFGENLFIHFAVQQNIVFQLQLYYFQLVIFHQNIFIFHMSIQSGLTSIIFIHAGKYIKEKDILNSGLFIFFY